MKTYKSKLPELQLKYKSGDFYRVKISESKDVASFLRKLFDSDSIEYTEETIVVYLNQANNTIGFEKHSKGGTTSTVVDVKPILSTALLSGASSIIFSHNHPSGNMNPSQEDIKMTSRLKIACEAIGIKLLDHIIVSGSDNKHYSFADEGKL